MITEPTIPKPERPASPGGLLTIFHPDPPAAVPITDPAEISTVFRVWQNRVLVTSIIGYAVFYFVRKNLPFAMPVMEKELHIDKERLGMFLTLQGVVYGVSKFANGFLADRSNARTFMAVALVACALLNVAFGFSTTVLAFGLIWMLNGWFQGMGYPPCARLITHWFPPKQLATKWSIWNMSHSIGAGLIAVLCGYLVTTDWRLCFFVPAIIALACAAFLWWRLPDTPPSVGLPEVEGTHAKSGESHSQSDFVFRQVFCNPYIWLVSFANFFVYTIRYAVFDWGPTMLQQAKHFEAKPSSWMLFGFEAFGLLGAMLGGWLTDRLLGGRAVRACVIYMALAGVSVFLLWKVPGQSHALTLALLCLTGFFIYGPQCLLAIVAANLATKRAAATAVGLTGILGYASTVLSGWGMGWLVKHHGWDAGFQVLLFSAAVGAFLFILAWPAKAHGYEQ